MHYCRTPVTHEDLPGYSFVIKANEGVSLQDAAVRKAIRTGLGQLSAKPIGVCTLYISTTGSLVLSAFTQQGADEPERVELDYRVQQKAPQPRASR